MVYISGVFEILGGIGSIVSKTKRAASYGLILLLLAVYPAHLKVKKARTNIEPWKPTTAIISDGIYSYSRNPIYVAMAIIYLGAMLIFNALWFLPLSIPVLFVIQFGVILREEKYLENKFGAEYSDYKKKVRRWI